MRFFGRVEFEGRGDCGGEGDSGGRGALLLLTGFEGVREAGR